jgi:hypothetical protein
MRRPSLLLLGLLIVLLAGDSHGGTVSQEVGINTRASSNTAAWAPSCSPFSSGDAQGEGTTPCTILDTQAALLGFNGTTWDRLRLSGTDSQLNTGVLVSGQYLWSQGSSRWNRQREVSTTDALSTGLAAAGMHGFNGTTWDRLRVAGTDSQPNTGVLVTGQFLWNQTGSAWNRQREVSSTDGVGTGFPGVMPYQFNGTTWDRDRGGRTPVQGGSPTGTVLNSQTTGAANTAVTITLTGTAGERVHVYKLTGRCSAGTSSLTVQDGATTIWSTPAGAVGTSNFTESWNPGLTMTTAANGVVTLAACGVGNTGTLTVQADRF